MKKGRSSRVCLGIGTRKKSERYENNLKCKDRAEKDKTQPSRNCRGICRGINDRAEDEGLLVRMPSLMLFLTAMYLTERPQEEDPEESRYDKGAYLFLIR